MKKTIMFAFVALFAAGLIHGGTITITQPAGGSFAMGAACPIHWTASGISSNVKIQLILRGGALVGQLANRLDPTSSPYPWVVASPAEADQTYRIRVSATDGSALGESEVFTVTAAGDPGTPGTISNVRISGTSPYTIGSGTSISWTTSGISQHLKLQLLRSDIRDVPSPIVNDLASGATLYPWPAGYFIGGTAAPADYKIRVSTVEGSISADSPSFTLTNFTAVQDVIIPQLYALQTCDLGYGSAGLEYSASRQELIAHIKNFGTTLIDRNVTFSIVFPDMVRDGAQQVTIPLYIPAGQERGIVVKNIPLSMIPLRTGLLTRVQIDGPLSQIAETNESNNTRELRLAALDLMCTRWQDVELSKLYMQGGDDFRVRFTIHIYNYMNLRVNNIHVHWTLYGPDGAMIDYNHIFDHIDGRGDIFWEIDEKYGKEGRSNAHSPKLREGVTYRVVAGVTDPGDELYDINPDNDSTSFTFRFPD